MFTTDNLYLKVFIQSEYPEVQYMGSRWNAEENFVEFQFDEVDQKIIAEFSNSEKGKHFVSILSILKASKQEIWLLSQNNRNRDRRAPRC